MARKSTSTPRRATSPSASSPSLSSIDSSPDTLETPSPEAATPGPPGLDAPVSSPEPGLSDVTATVDDLVTRRGLHNAIRGQLATLVEAIDAYTGQGGPWDDVLYQVETAKALLGLAGG